MEESPVEVWYRVDMTRDEVVNNMQIDLRMRYQQIYTEAGSPEGASLWNGWISATPPFTSVYLSPAAAALAPQLVIEFNAKAVLRPDVSRLGFLIGSESDRLEEPGRGQ